MNVCILLMLYFYRIEVSKAIDVNKKMHQKSVILVSIGIS